MRKQEWSAFTAAAALSDISPHSRSFALFAGKSEQDSSHESTRIYANKEGPAFNAAVARSDMSPHSRPFALFAGKSEQDSSHESTRIYANNKEGSAFNAAAALSDISQHSRSFAETLCSVRTIRSYSNFGQLPKLTSIPNWYSVACK